MRRGIPVFLLVLGAAFALLAGSLVACGGEEEPPPLKIGLLLHFGDSPSQNTLGRQRAFDLAIQHVNAGGGVFGRDVEVAVGDASLDAAGEARRLVEDEGVHALVGPTSSAASLLVIEAILGEEGVPIVSPAASSPMLTTANDGDFFFRTVLSDIAQGPVLARLTRDLGFDNVGLVYRDDAWGQGLAAAFEEAWTGSVASVAIAPDQASYLAEIRSSASGGARALVVLTFGTEGEIIVREAIEDGLYDRFVFGDALRRLELIEAIGADRLGGMYGVSGAHEHGTPAAEAWEAAMLAEYGEVPELTYIRETYDATIAIALAAQAAGGVEGAAIRDALRGVGSAPGEVVIAGPEGVARALRILEDGGEVDYQGAAGSIDWDENGDLARGAVAIWRFTADGAIEDVDLVVYER